LSIHDRAAPRSPTAWLRYAQRFLSFRPHHCTRGHHHRSRTPRAGRGGRRTHLGLDADCSLAAAVTAANARAGLAAEGGLVAQVERLTELLFWDEAGGAA